MKLILENENNELKNNIVESVDENTGKKKKEYYLTGIFSTAGVKNANGRIYPREIWEREVASYQKVIAENGINSLGEWEHPARADVDPMKAVIKIVELKLEGNYVYGKAKILDNPEGNRLKTLIDEGIKIDISSRGVGSVGKNGIVEEFKLITYDLVSKASNPGSQLSGIVEGKEYMISESGCIEEINCSCSLKENENNKKIQQEIIETLEKNKGYATIQDVNGNNYLIDKYIIENMNDEIIYATDINGKNVEIKLNEIALVKSDLKKIEKGVLNSFKNLFKSFK